MKRFIISICNLFTSFCCAHEGIEVLIPAQDIAKRIKEVTRVLDENYAHEEVTIVMVMKGAVCVTADLIRQLNVPCTIDAISVSSYGRNGTTPGRMRVAGLDELDVKGKHVLLVDDIFDTGNTLCTLLPFLEEKQPKSLKSLVLLLKDVPRKHTYRPDFVLFTIPDRFVIGYGMDYKEYYRGLPDVCAFVNDTPIEQP